MILSAAFTGLTNTFAKPLIDIEGYTTMEISPITLVAMIYLINALFFTPLAKNCTPLKTIGRRNMFFLALIGIAEVSALMTYFFGLKETTAINSAILSEGDMIFSMLIAITILRERLRRKELTPFAMIIVGMVILPIGIDLYENGFVFSNMVFGDFLVLLSGLFYALDINLCKYVSKRLDARRITQISSLVSGIFAVSLMFMFNVPFNVDWSQVPSIVVLAIVGTGLSAFFFIVALKLIGAIRTLLIFSSTSAFGIIFSSAFLGEAITLTNVASILLVMGGIYLLRTRLAEDDSDKGEKLHPVVTNHKRKAKIKLYKLSSIKGDFYSSATIQDQNRVKLLQFARILSGFERNLWLLLFNMKRPTLFQSYNEPMKIFSYSLEKSIFKIIYHNKQWSHVKWKARNPLHQKKYERLTNRSISKGGG